MWRAAVCAVFATCVMILPAGVAYAQNPALVAPPRVVIGPFAIDQTEVTIGAFRVVMDGKTTAAQREGGGFEYMAGWVRRSGWTWAQPMGQPGSDTEPVTHISWSEAQDYCRAVGGRLPSSAEWQLAAYSETRDVPTDGFRKGQTYRYPVGDAPNGMNAGSKSHVAVASTKRGVNGLYDMGGNVWEWLSDRRGDQALTAGSSWWYGADNTRAEGAQWKAASFYAVYIGFRCAYDVKS